MAGFLSQLEWRNATKKFDANRPVADAQLEQICAAIHMAPSSYGLQPFYVKVVKDAATKAKLQAAGMGQPQFPSSAATLVFVARTDVAERVDGLITGMSRGDATTKQALKPFESMLQGFAKGLTEPERKVWAQKQCYLALGFALAACAELNIASCPMEGFSPEEFNKILALPSGHYASVVLTIGHAAADFKPFPKFRFPRNDMIR